MRLELVSSGSYRKQWMMLTHRTNKTLKHSFMKCLAGVLQASCLFEQEFWPLMNGTAGFLCAQAALFQENKTKQDGKKFPRNCHA
jgi:hypothetical protein